MALRPKSTTITSEDGESKVSIPDFVDFNPEEFMVSLEEALKQAQLQGERNLEQYGKNFTSARDYAFRNLDTEVTGLESFIPRSSRLIRAADAQRNSDVLGYSDVFDARNERAARRATQGNVAVRGSIFNDYVPGAFESAANSLRRSEGDVSRIRDRESEPLLDSVLREKAAADARRSGADYATTTGMGVDSSSGVNLLDRFDVGRRIELEQLNRSDARQGDQAIQNAETSVRNAIAASQNLFTGIIAPAIKDYSPLIAQPGVTDIGGQIRPTPAVDAGSIQRNITDNLTNLSTIAPSTVLQGSLNTQQFNSGVGLQALGFEQEKFNTISAAENNLYDKEEQKQREAQAQSNFQAGLDQREQSELIQAGTQLLTTGVIGAAAGGLFGTSAGVSSIGSATPGAAELSAVQAAAATIPGAEVAAGGSAIAVPASASIPAGYEAVGSAVLADGSPGVLAAPTQGAFMSNLAALGPYAAAAADGYFAFRGAEKLVNGGSNSDLSLLEHAALMPITGGLHLAVPSVRDTLGGLFSSGKPEDQKIRDDFREDLKDAKVIDSKYHLKLATGGTFDIGLDGGAKLQNAGINIDGKKERAYSDVDFSNPIAGQVVGMTNALSAVLFGDKKSKKMVGHLTNAVTSSDDPQSLEAARLNTKGIALDAKVTYSDGVERLEKYKSQYTQAEYDALKNGWYSIFFG